MISTSGGNGSSGSSTSGGSSTSTSGGGDPTLLAEAGPDQWGDLGASFLFNGCESLFSDALICDFSEGYLQDHFMAAWYLGDQQIGSGFSITLDTGEGTLFDSPQSYLLTFEIIFLDGGSPILTSTDQARLALARRNISEPAILLIFVASILGLGYLRWRRWWA
ncbi:MAG: hypothetical protein DCC73_15205 [Proteobacteria bacterium]|nr:MAG: hypothetical protein DCC73_15205 [Pseudomonadota bacterium]